MRKTPGIAIIILLFAGLSCNKGRDEAPASLNLSDISEVVGNTRLQYSDSLFFPGTPAAPVVPVSRPSAKGYFTATPEGLSINANSGEINVNTSETGLPFTVYYVSNSSGQRLDSAFIMISGINYPDGIYDLSNSGQRKLTPVYNDDHSAPVPGQPHSPDEDKRSKFDETDLDGDGLQDTIGANDQHLVVNEQDGVIDLSSSYLEGVFGHTPADGETRDITVYYRLADKSDKALDRITVRLYYYSTASAIPKWLKDEIKRRQADEPQTRAAGPGPASAGRAPAAPATPGPTPPAPKPAPGVSAGPGIVIASNSVVIKPKRPPLIIVVSGMTVSL